MRPTASAIDRLAHCQWWAREGVPWTDAPSAASERGVAIHAECERIVGGAAPETAEGRSFAAWLAAAGVVYRSEVAMRLDTATGRSVRLDLTAHRGYGHVAASEVAGTADLVSAQRVALDTIEVADIKTGRVENVEPAATNAQLRTLAVMAARIAGVSSVRVGLLHVSAAGVLEDWHELDALDLDLWLSVLEVYARSIPSSQPSPGAHCRYCPALAACPATQASVALAVPADVRRLPLVTRAGDFSSTDHARAQYETLRAAKALIDAAWGAVRAYSDDVPIPVGDSVVYGPHTSSRESIALDDAAAVEALRTGLGEHWERAVALETTKTAIKAAARTAAAATGSKAAAIERATLAALRAAGAIKTHTSRTYEEHPAAPSLPAQGEKHDQ